LLLFFISCSDGKYGQICERELQAIRQQQQQNEQADSRLEERWHTTVKEESVAVRHFGKAFNLCSTFLSTMRILA